MRNKQLSELDAFQVAAFKAHYRRNLRHMDILTSFARAIFDTDDINTEEMFKAHPSAIQRWHSSRGYNKRATA